MRCPICSKETFFDGNPYRPFCSQRCKLIDLDNWLLERYRFLTPVEEPENTQFSSIRERGAKGDRG